MARLFPPLLLALAVAGPAAGQRAPSELKGLQAEFRDETARALTLRAEAEAAAAELRTLETRLEAIRTEATEEDDQVTAQRRRLRELSAREASLSAEAAREHGAHGRLLSALQMMSRRPPPPLLIPSEKAVDTVRAAILLKAMAPEMQARARAMAARRAELAQVRRIAVLSSEALFTAESRQGDRRAEVETLVARQRALRAVLAAEADQAARAAAALESRIRALGGSVPTVDAETTERASPLPAGRARLSPPVSGAPIRRFGGGSSGWRWRAGGTVVVAPAAGRVIHTGALRGWGQVVIIDVGPGWRAVLAGMDAVQVATGQTVTDGQALGRVAEGGEAYLELRRDDRPIDPAPFLQ